MQSSSRRGITARRPWMVGVAAAVFSGLLATDSATADVYNLHLVTDNVPDYTDLESFVRSATDAWEKPEDKCIAIWRWGRRSRRQTSCAVENGRTPPPGTLRTTGGPRSSHDHWHTRMLPRTTGTTPQVLGIRSSSLGMKVACGLTRRNKLSVQYSSGPLN